MVSRVKAVNKNCQVAIQISSNPSNQKRLSDFTIMMEVPRNVLGETLTTQPVGGVYNASKRSVIWNVENLGPGQKFQLLAIFKLEETIEMYGESPSFPLIVRCISLHDHLSGIVVECEDEPNGFPADVNFKVGKRFRVAHTDRDSQHL